MNKKSLGIVVAVVVLALLAYFFLFNKKSTAPTTSDTAVQGTNQTQNTAQQASGPQSLKELLAAGSSTKCTFNESGSEGTVFVSKGKSRADFKSGTQAGHMVMMDNYSYLWMDGASQGYKAALNDQAAQAPSGSAQGVDAGKKMNYSCTPWSVDSKTFELPASVKFLDFGDFMKVPQK